MNFISPTRLNKIRNEKTKKKKRKREREIYVDVCFVQNLRRNWRNTLYMGCNRTRSVRSTVTSLIAISSGGWHPELALKWNSVSIGYDAEATFIDTYMTPLSLSLSIYHPLIFHFAGLPSKWFSKRKFLKIPWRYLPWLNSNWLILILIFSRWTNLLVMWNVFMREQRSFCEISNERSYI